MSNFRLSGFTQDAIALRLGSLMSGATIRIYDGEQPKNPAITQISAKLLVELRFEANAFKSASKGTIRSGKIEGRRAIATGQARWARIFDAQSHPLVDCDVGKNGATICLNSVDIVERGLVEIDEFSISIPLG